MSSLPTKEKKSEQKVVEFFDSYFTKKIQFPVSEYDAVVGFFDKRNFGETASRTVSQVIMTQAKKESISVFKLIDSLGKLNEPSLSTVVTKILNASRGKTSQLGYRTVNNNALTELRSIGDKVNTEPDNVGFGQDQVEGPDLQYITTGYVEQGYVL